MNQELLLLLLSIQMLSVSECQIDTTGCSPVPLTCFDPTNSPNICNTDADCKDGKKCCYKSCFKKCVAYDPCANVVCKQDHLCQVIQTKCNQPYCDKEASCVPAEEVNCPPRQYLISCPPGFERAKDGYGCRTGPCQAKKKCPATCKMMCSHGYVLDGNGCPTCRCKTPPEHPCSIMRCSRGLECRLKMAMTSDTSIPAFLLPNCVPKNVIPAAPVDTSCSLINYNTAGLPIINESYREIDCSSKACPPHSVCVGISYGINRCCWQHTQHAVMAAPKVGECPPSPMIPFNIAITACEIDAHCPGDMKCCYVNKERGRRSYIGLCLSPVHVELSNPNLCRLNDGRQWFLKILRLC